MAFAFLLISLAVVLFWRKESTLNVTQNPMASVPATVEANPLNLNSVQANRDPIPTQSASAMLATTTSFSSEAQNAAPIAKKAKSKKQDYLLKVYPLHAEIAVDGVRYGMSPVQARWLPGRHRIEASSALGQWDTLVDFPAHRKLIEIVLNRY